MTERAEKPFGTPEQIAAAEAALATFASAYPEAFRALQTLWKQHYLEVGHKALGRMVLGKTAEQLIARKARAGQRSE